MNGKTGKKINLLPGSLSQISECILHDSIIHSGLWVCFFVWFSVSRLSFFLFNRLFGIYGETGGADIADAILPYAEISATRIACSTNSSTIYRVWKKDIEIIPPLDILDCFLAYSVDRIFHIFFHLVLGFGSVPNR